MKKFHRIKTATFSSTVESLEVACLIPEADGTVIVFTGTSCSIKETCYS